jgi:hypothetical protein
LLQLLLFSFLLSAFFVAAGSDKGWQASALFGCRRLLLFLLSGFYFIPQVVVLLFFGPHLSVDNVACYFFKKQFLNHTWLCGVCFLLWRFLADSVSLFYAGNFCGGIR